MKLFTNEDAADLLAQEEVRSVLKPHLTAFHDCMVAAIQTWAEFGAKEPDFRHGLSNYTKARWIYDHIVKRIEAHFAGKEGVTILRRHGMLLLGIDGRLIVRFKKLNKKLRSRNYPTPHARAMCEQKHLPNMPEATRVTAGYVLDATGTIIAALEITCPIGLERDPLWHFAFTNEAVVPHPVMDELPATTTRVKAKQVN